MASRKSGTKNTAAAAAATETAQTLSPLAPGEVKTQGEGDDAESVDDLVPQEPERPEPRMISVSLPLGELDPKEYRSAHIDMHLTPEQADTLRELSLGLRGMPFELTADGLGFRQNGRLVDSGQNALRWLLNGLAIAKRRRASEAESSPESSAQESEDSEAK